MFILLVLTHWFKLVDCCNFHLKSLNSRLISPFVLLLQISVSVVVYTCLDSLIKIEVWLVNLGRHIFCRRQFSFLDQRCKSFCL